MKLATNMIQEDDQMFLISHPTPSFYTQSPLSNEGESRCRRRRKKESEKITDIGFRKRKLSDEQVKILEESFGNEHKLESERKDKIAAQLGLDPRQVAVWFQNRRVRWKTKKLEEEYSKLKMKHECVIIEKSCLESEVLKLKQQLNGAEKEIQKLLEERVSTGSPISSFCMDNYNQDFVGEFGVMNNGSNENLLYDQENYYVYQEMEWVNLYGL